MMDLDEARISLDLYANTLDFQCRQYSVTVDLTESCKNDKEIEPLTSGLTDRTMADLRRLQRESLILRVQIDRAIAREPERLARLPKPLLDLLEAKNRNAMALNRADNLLAEHDQKEAEKAQIKAQENEPKKPTPLQLAIREFREKQALEQINDAIAVPQKLSPGSEGHSSPKQKT
jgi:hypothetical protein